MDTSKSAFVRGHAAAWVAKAYAVARLTQMQMADFNAEMALSGALEFFTLAKHPDHRLRLLRAFWLPARGISGTRAWMPPLLAMIRDTPFILRDHNGKGGDPRLATAWKPCACTHAKANASLKSLLLMIGVAPADVDRYKSASFRKFLPNVARARGLSGQTRNEIGQWANSDAQQAADRAARKKRRRGPDDDVTYAMPDRYSLEAARELAVTLMQQQIDAAAQLAAVGNDSLPLHGGWDLLLRATAGAARAGGGGASRLDTTNADVCAGCGSRGDLVMCDACSDSWHLPCLEQRLGRSVTLPTGDWHCPACSAC